MFIVSLLVIQLCYLFLLPSEWLILTGVCFSAEFVGLDYCIETLLKETDFHVLPQLERELEVCEKESGELQEYANSVLQQIADYCPDILEQVVNALEESC